MIQTGFPGDWKMRLTPYAEAYARISGRDIDEVWEDLEMCAIQDWQALMIRYEETGDQGIHDRIDRARIINELYNQPKGKRKNTVEMEYLEQGYIQGSLF